MLDQVAYFCIIELLLNDVNVDLDVFESKKFIPILITMIMNLVERYSFSTKYYSFDT